MGCVFCKTGTLGFLRNLTSAEIVEQYFHLLEIAPDLSHIVVMGMGEPLLNLDALRTAVAILTDENGLALSKRRITLSTSGIVEGIRELADRGPETRLALSLTTADDELRSRLMPINKTNSLDRLKEALVYYQKRYKKRITLEAVLLKGLNTRLEDAKALKNFAQGLETIINLIPWNPVEDLSLEGEALQEPTEAEVERFALELERRGLAVTRRYRKGRGVAGACGQLGSTELFPPQS
jgi:23S rRNA (adenine2503-C2)-methyltransferase